MEKNVSSSWHGLIQLDTLTVAVQQPLPGVLSGRRELKIGTVI
jgi:hypothetical protein